MKNELITDNMALVPPIARRYARDAVGCEYEDLVQTGYLALCVAAERYDPDHDAAFSTFATIRIEGAIIDDLRRYLHHDADPSSSPFDDSPTNGSPADGENGVIFVSYTQALNIPCDEDMEADHTLRARERHEIVNLLMNQLTHREWEVVHLYYLQGLTQEQIAKVIGTSQQNVDRRLDAAIQRMRAYAQKHNIEW